MTSDYRSAELNIKLDLMNFNYLQTLIVVNHNIIYGKCVWKSLCMQFFLVANCFVNCVED